MIARCEGDGAVHPIVLLLGGEDREGNVGWIHALFCKRGSDHRIGIGRF